MRRGDRDDYERVQGERNHHNSNDWLKILWTSIILVGLVMGFLMYMSSKISNGNIQGLGQVPASLLLDVNQLRQKQNQMMNQLKSKQAAMNQTILKQNEKFTNLQKEVNELKTKQNQQINKFQKEGNQMKLKQNEQIGRLEKEVNQLKSKLNDMATKSSGHHRALIQQTEQTGRLNAVTYKLQEEMIELQKVEIQKKNAKSMSIYQRFSKPFNFQVDTRLQKFAQNFKVIQAQGSAFDIIKRTDEEAMFYSQQSITKKEPHYFRIKIIETMSGMIAIGIIPANKKTDSCVYCDSKHIYYIYCRNGKIYHGYFLQIVKDSNPTRFSQLKANDIITVFVDNKQQTVSWYVNGLYAGSQNLELGITEWYPFIEITSRGDIVRIMKQ